MGRPRLVRGVSDPGNRLTASLTAGDVRMGSPRAVEVPRAARLTRGLGLAFLLVVLGLLILYPFGMLLYGSLREAPPGDPGGLNLAGLWRALTLANIELLARTLLLAGLGAALSSGVAITFAWLLGRTDVPAAGLWEAVVTLPLFLPPVLLAISWGMLGAPRVGLLNLAASRWLGLPPDALSTYSYGGLVWYLFQYGVALQLSMLLGAMANLDASLEEAARVSGASRWTAARRVVLPLLFPAVSGAFLYWLVRGFETFEGPLILGVPAGIRMFGPQVYELIHHRMRPEYQEATALSVVGVLLMFPLVVLQWRRLSGRAFWTVTGKGYLARPVKLGRWRWAAVLGLTAYAVVVVGLPVGQLVLGSLSPFFGFYEFQRFSWRHYAKVLSDGYVMGAIRNTLLASSAAAVGTLALALGVGYALTRVRGQRRLIWAINLLSWLPLLAPGIVLGLALLWAYAFAPRWLELYGSVWGLVVAYVTLTLPVAVRTVQGALAQVAVELEEAARVCGAPPLLTLLRVTLPLLWRSLAAAWVLCFLLSAREASASLMLAAPGAQVLSVALVYLWSQGRMEEVAALGIVMMFPVLLLRYFLGVLSRGAGVVLR